MAGTCERCCDKSSELDCTDCGRDDKKVALCLDCSNLLHVGFMKEHNIETNEVKEKRTDFEENVKNYKKREQVLKRSVVEIKHAYQNVASRNEDNKFTLEQALAAINKALKKKEAEVGSWLKSSGSKLRDQLEKGQKQLEQRLTRLQECHEKASQIASAGSSTFLAGHAKITEEIEVVLGEELSMSLGSLNPPVHINALNVSKVIASIQGFGSEVLTKPVSQETPQLADSLREIKEGDEMKVYLETTMDERGCFWMCQDLVADIANGLNDLSFEIRKDIILSGWEDLTIQEGSLCVAQYHQDNRWYRARVEKLKEHRADVRWLDYAHTDEVQLSHIQPLRERFAGIPIQGLECTLFEDISEEMPRQAKWVFGDLTKGLMLSCTVIKKLNVPDRGKVPLYLVKLEHTGEEKQDISETVWNKAQEYRSSKGSIGCRDVRLLNKDNKDIQVMKHVVNATKKDTEGAPEAKPEGEERTGSREEDDEKKMNSEKKEEVDGEKGGEGNGAETKQEENGKIEEGKEDSVTEDGMMDKLNNDEVQGDAEETAAEKPSEGGEKNEGEKKDGETSEGEKMEGEKNGGAKENGEEEEGVVEEEEEKDGGEGQEDLSLAQKLEKQGDSAPDQTNAVEGTHMCPMAFIAAHGSYTAINGSSGTESSNTSPYPQPQSHPQSQPSWYGPGPGYGGPYGGPGRPGMGQPQVTISYPLVPGLPATGETYGLATGAVLTLHVATPLTAAGTFWATRVRGHEQDKRLRRLTKELDEPSEPLSRDQLHRGKMVCAYDEANHEWRRATVEDIAKDGVGVRLSDYGCMMWVDGDGIKTLVHSPGSLPPQAFECSLTKDHQTTFSEASMKLFHRLTHGKIATARVEAEPGADGTVYVTLFLSGEDGQVRDVSAEINKQGEPSKPESEGTKPEAEAVPQGKQNSEQPKAAPRISFSDMLRDTYWRSPQFVHDIEMEFAGLISSTNDSPHPNQSYTFPPMSREQRAFVHELKDAYRLQSDSIGQDPTRQVVITALRLKSCVPSPLLSETCQSEGRPPMSNLMDDQSSEHMRYMGGNVREDPRACYLCGDIGHRKSNCPKNRRGGERRKESSWWGDGRKGRKGGGGGRR